MTIIALAFVLTVFVAWRLWCDQEGGTPRACQSWGYHSPSAATPARTAPAALFELWGVGKTFRSGSEKEIVFSRLNLFVPGDCRILGIAGPSGGGKTTLLHMLAGLEVPTSGSVFVLGKLLPHDINRLEGHRRQVGLVLQDHNLIGHLSARDNIALPQCLLGIDDERARARADRWLAEFGLMSLADRKPAELSGGQQQRVAIARALASGAKLVLADEPTSALDPENREQVWTALRRIADEFGVRVVIVSHDFTMIDRCDYVLTVAPGAVDLSPAPHEPALAVIELEPQPPSWAAMHEVMP